MSQTKSLEKHTTIFFCENPVQQGTTPSTLLPTFASLSHCHPCSLTGVLSTDKPGRIPTNRYGELGPCGQRAVMRQVFVCVEPHSWRSVQLHETPLIALYSQPTHARWPWEGKANISTPLATAAPGLHSPVGACICSKHRLSVVCGLGKKKYFLFCILWTFFSFPKTAVSAQREAPRS